MRNPCSRIAALLQQVTSAKRITADRRSFVRLACDLILYRLMRFARLPRQNGMRSIDLRTGGRLNYRLNRGDIWAIYEIWICGAYRLPFPVGTDSILDLGANIGLTSLWYAANLRPRNIIAVEASPGNAAVIKRNFADNRIEGTVIVTAVGPVDGEAVFREYNWSTYNEVVFGQGEARALSDGLRLIRESPIRVTSVGTILAALPPGDRISLAKIDIEGTEQALFTGDISWLNCIDAIVVEFHPPRANMPILLEILRKAGFRHIPPSHKFPMHSFTRAQQLPVGLGA